MGATGATELAGAAEGDTAEKKEGGLDGGRGCHVGCRVVKEGALRKLPSGLGRGWQVDLGDWFFSRLSTSIKFQFRECTK